MAESFTDVSNAPLFKQRHNEGFVPQKVEDFGDGGAFPEIHIAQFPLNMGRVVLGGGSKIVRQNQTVYSHYKHLVPKVLLSVKENVGDEKEEEELQREIEETTQQTKTSFEKILNLRFTTARQQYSSKFIKYKPSQQSASVAFNSGSKERIINILEMPADPLDPPKFMHKSLTKPSASASPPVPVMHSPPRPVTVKD
nr:isoform 2 of snw/ski-interacting protein [Quercus suber]